MSYVLRRDKANDGKVPIALKIVVNGRKAELFIKRKIFLDKWDEKGKVIGASADVKSFNRYLDKLYNQAHEIYEKLRLERQPVSAEIIKSNLLGKSDGEDEITLLYLCRYHNEQTVNSLSENTIRHYETTARYFMRFLNQKRKVGDILIDQINYKFIIDFESFLRAWKPEDHQRPMANNGVMKHMSRFRKLINLAVKVEWIENNPFKNYRTRYQSVTREFLTEHDLTAIENKELKMPRLMIVRDIFVFCCYTGLSYIDVFNLKEDHIVQGIDGEKWIHFMRHKTKTPFQIPLLPKALAILEKYKGYPRLKDDCVLPVFSNQKTNSYLKEIADVCGVRKSLTFHLARHTFATTVTLTNGVPIESVSKMLGHTKIATTQIYAKVIEKKVSEDMKALRTKLDNNTKSSAYNAS